MRADCKGCHYWHGSNDISGESRYSMCHFLYDTGELKNCNAANCPHRMTNSQYQNFRKEVSKMSVPFSVKEKAIAMLKEGKTQVEIYKELGISKSTMTRLADGYKGKNNQRAIKLGSTEQETKALNAVSKAEAIAAPKGLELYAEDRINELDRKIKEVEEIITEAAEEKADYIRQKDEYEKWLEATKKCS